MRKNPAIRSIVLASALASEVLVGGASAPSEPDSTVAARGEAVAERACAACHGMGLEGRSSFPNAPAFRDMRIDYNAISYERRMAQLHAGRVGMPPATVSLAEVADIVAYVRRLRSSQSGAREAPHD